MTIRTPSRFIRRYTRTVDLPRRSEPPRAYQGPAASVHLDPRIARMMGGIAKTFDGASFLGLVQRDDGHWLCATTC